MGGLRAGDTPKITSTAISELNQNGAPCWIMQIIKGGTSNKIRELFPELDEIYWGATFWGDGTW
jgi:hypothetical protein